MNKKISRVIRNATLMKAKAMENIANKFWSTNEVEVNCVNTIEITNSKANITRLFATIFTLFLLALVLAAFLEATVLNLEFLETVLDRELLELDFDLTAFFAGFFLPLFAAIV